MTTETTNEVYKHKDTKVQRFFLDTKTTSD